MTTFTFSAEAALEHARTRQRLPNRPNLPNRCASGKAGLGGLGRLGTVRAVDSQIPSDADDPRASDADGVARTPEAIEAVWNAAEERARRYKAGVANCAADNQADAIPENAAGMPWGDRNPPACTVCGEASWTVAPATAGGPLMHWECWQVTSDDDGQ